MSEPVIRWMLLNKDLEQVLGICQSRGNGRTEEYFGDSCHNNDNVNIVVEHEGEVRGYAIYRNHPYKVEILDIATSPTRSGYGRDLISMIEERLTPTRTRMEIHVPEENLEAQLFFKTLEFRAVRIYESKSGQTYYVFVRKLYFPEEKEM